MVLSGKTSKFSSRISPANNSGNAKPVQTNRHQSTASANQIDNVQNSFPASKYFLQHLKGMKQQNNLKLTSNIESCQCSLPNTDNDKMLNDNKDEDDNDKMTIYDVDGHYHRNQVENGTENNDNNDELDSDASTKNNNRINHEICCLLADNSPPCFITNFSSMIELYERIAESFDISINEIMYCTLNTPKINMDQVLTGRICLNDIIFVHRKGKRKKVEVRKTEPLLGLTIADNGNGCSYIKQIKSNSTAARVPFIQVGDHIESIMGENMIGLKHYEVANYLHSIPLNEIFTISLVEPIAWDNLIQQQQQQIKSLSPLISYEQRLNDDSAIDELDVEEETTNDHHQFNICANGTAKKTLMEQNRMRPTNCRHYQRNENDEIAIDDNGNADANINVDNVDAAADDDDINDELLLKFRTGIFHINKQLEKFIGINDDELAEELWLMASGQKRKWTRLPFQEQCIKKSIPKPATRIKCGSESAQKWTEKEKCKINNKNGQKLKFKRVNPHEFAQQIFNSDLSEFKFTDDFIFDIWAIVNDVLNGNVKLADQMAPDDTGQSCSKGKCKVVKKH